MSKNTEKEENSSFICQLDDNESGVYEIDIKTLYYKGTGKNMSEGERIRSSVIWANSEGHEIFYRITQIIKDELSPMVGIKNEPKDIFHRTRKFIFNRFNQEDISKGSENLEKCIKKEINDLKSNIFIAGLDSDFEDIKVSLDEIIEMFISLRNQKIKFYEAVLKEYRNRSQDYNKVLKL